MTHLVEYFRKKRLTLGLRLGEVAEQLGSEQPKPLAWVQSHPEV